MFYNFGASVASWPTLKCGAHSRKKNIFYSEAHTEQKYAIWFRLCYLYGQKV